MTEAGLRLSFDVFAAKAPLRPQFARRAADRHWALIRDELSTGERLVLEAARARALATYRREAFDDVCDTIRRARGWRP